MTSIIEETGSKMLPRIVLLACGSFSPPTPMHFRMFEIARDYFEMQGTHQVIGGIISPTNDAYGKKGLAAGVHRCAMVKLALQSSSWIRVSDWEVMQPQWTKTRSVLQYHQNFMNNYINSPHGDEVNGHLPGWLPLGLCDRREGVQLKLLCGADLLESFAVPGLWAIEDIEDIIANHGLVVITRNGTNPEKFVFESDILTKYQRNITLVTNWVPNEVSSTMIRRLLGRGQSVKYLIDDLVLEYIQTNGLFNCNTKYITNKSRLFQSKCHLELSEQVQMSTASLSNTPSDDDDDDDADVNNAQRMDDADYSIKTILTNINLDNRKSNVFCCREKDKRSVNLLQNRTSPGQAVKVITCEIIGSTERIMDPTERKPKKMKINEESV